MRRGGTAVGVSLGGVGTSEWGEGDPAAAAAAAAILGPPVDDTEGAGVSGGGGEVVVVGGASGGAAESRSLGLGVSRGGVGVAGTGESGVEGEAAVAAEAAAIWAPLVATSLASDWLTRTGSLSILQQHQSTLLSVSPCCLSPVSSIHVGPSVWPRRARAAPGFLGAGNGRVCVCV